MKPSCMESSRMLGGNAAIGPKSFSAARKWGRGTFTQQRQRRNTVVVRAAEENERKGWDVNRFVKTVAFFNKPPSPGEVLSTIISQPARIFSALTGDSTEDKKAVILPLFGDTAMAQPSSSSGRGGSGGRRRDGIVLVSGATGGVGKRVVQVLLSKGKAVRALVRDVDKAKQLLGSLKGAPGSSLELLPADIVQPATLLPEMFEGVTSAVLATAAKVSPKEGDTPDRRKYMQGIKFYNPEVVGDTPETVEYRGLQNLVHILREHVGLRAGKLIFAPDGSGAAKEFGSLDDVVMGGRSESGFTVEAGAGEDGASAGVFSGLVTTENNGGFASVRTRNLEPAADLAAYEGLCLRVRGNSLRFKCIVRTDSNWDGIAYCRSFDTKDGEWQTIRLPWSEFIPVFRAKTLTDGSYLDPSSVYSIQLMLSKFEYDGELNPAFRAGPFRLPVTEIRSYLPEPITPRIVHISSAGVTRPNRPGIDVEAEPPAVKMNDMLGGLLTYKLKGEDVVRDSGVPFAVVRPTALTEEDAGAEVVVDQGDTIKGKIAREDIAQLAVALLEAPQAADTTFEVKSTQPFPEPYKAPQDAQPRDWQAVLQAANLQKGVTGKTIGGRYTGKEPEAADVHGAAVQ